MERKVVGVIADDVLVCGSTESLHLQRVDVDGLRLDDLIVHRTPVAVSRAEVDALRRQEADKILRGQEQRRRSAATVPFSLEDKTEERLERLKEREAYRTRPAFRSLVGSSDGVLWVEDYGAPDRTEASWARVEGSVVTGYLTVPIGETVLDIDHGVLLTRSEDELGVHSVHIRRIVLSGG